MNKESKSSDEENAKNIQWHPFDIQCLYEESNKLLYWLAAAEEGLSDKTRSEAAHVECRVFAKTFFVLRSIARLLAATQIFKDKKFEYYRLSAALAKEDDCPSFLDAFEKYIDLFGDPWYDEDYHRGEIFNLISKSFLSIITNLSLLVERPLEQDREFSYAIGFFMERFRIAAAYEDHRARAKQIVESRADFKILKSTLVNLIDSVPDTEEEYLKKSPGTKPILPEKGFFSWLKYFSKISTKEGDLLLKRLDDHRQDGFGEDPRYDRIAALQSIWHHTSPSVTRFVELCRLVEQGALIATRNEYDWHLSSRHWISAALNDLVHHPKGESAETIADFAFSEDEKDQMSVAFKNMSLALLRYRSKLKQTLEIGRPDPDEYDDFVRMLPKKLGPDSRNYKSLLFEEGNARENDGYNNEAVGYLSWLAGPQNNRIFTLRSDKLEKEKAAVERTLKKAFATGSRQTIEKTYDELIERYFPKKKSTTRTRKASAEIPLGMDSQETMTSAETLPEPGKDYKCIDRFSYAPKFETIIDMSHRGGTYAIKPYERFTAASVVEIIKTLLRAVGKKDGWVKADSSWRLRFKDKPYKRFKDEQIQVGTRANQHLGEWRIIPSDLFQELTKAPPKATSSVGCVGQNLATQKPSHR